jgi:hypothetical protein
MRLWKKSGFKNLEYEKSYLARGEFMGMGASFELREPLLHIGLSSIRGSVWFSSFKY